MIKGQNWQKIRAVESPCNDCIYNLLCPPLSGYESVIGKNNLCKFKWKNISQLVDKHLLKIYIKNNKYK